MSIFTDMDFVLKDLGIPYQTGVYKGNAPDTYLVMVPLTDSFAVHADTLPGMISRKFGYPCIPRATTWPIKIISFSGFCLLELPLQTAGIWVLKQKPAITTMLWM